MEHLDVDKIERASSTATSMDHGTTEHQNRAIRPLSLTGGNHLSLDDVDPVDIQIRDLSVTVDTSPSIWTPSTYPELLKSHFTRNRDHAPKIKTLIHSVSASLRPGTLTAILGGSGSGKTTLLNTISERMTSSPRLTQSGTVLCNGRPSIHSVRHAYVMQQDVLLPTLTVRETLQYSADLRLPASTTAADRARVVDEVILELGLKECASTRIGNSQHRGCSGGEKRRVSIGVQMLSNPSVLFLDEPTTGLDASSAFQLVRTLKGLALKGRTVVVTIHQPRSEIWDLFDGLIVLARGSPVYSGPVRECLPWFADLGFELPGFVNPAEFVIDVAAVDNRSPELEEESAARVRRLKEAWAAEAGKVFGTPEKGAEGRARSYGAIKTSTPFLRQLRVLTDRSFKVTYRDPMGMAAALMEAVLMGLVNGYIFYNLSRDQAGIRSREGALYTAAALQGYLFLVFEVYRLTIDIPTFDREHSEGCADPLPFLLSRRLSRLFTEDFPVPFLFSVIFYFMAGFDRDPSKFFVFFSIVLINQYIAVTCAMTCVATARNFPGASLISNLVYTLQSVACGYFIQSNTIPVYVRWLKYIAYCYYAVGALFANEFQDSFYDCPFDGGESNPECVSYTGRYIMDSLGFPQNWVTRPIIILVAFVVFFYTLSWIGLKFLKVEMTISRARTSEADLSAGKEKMTARSIADVRTIDVGLVDFALDLDKRSATGKKLPTKTILEPVTATFQAGVLNVIMGPSGSGKTSLLNAMALRLDNGIGTRYRPSGKLVFNGAEPSNSVIRSVCSYVCQDDDALLPSLTVRETLQFAAGLRLPSWMSKDEKHKRAQEVLLKMGLKDCADNLVGNDLVKGISGGEKRRVTIAVQILTDPRVLLLDEPTSGLDAFTASSIMEVLQGLANEGRTLILTIHQARSDVFKHFGNVLLLARGGSPAYAGPAREMLGYFERQGFECPRHTNPADFALDLITIDLQQEDREAETREKVRLLIEAWTTEARHHPNDQTAKPRLPDIEEEEPTSSKLPHSSSSTKQHTLASPAELGALVRSPSPLHTSLPILLHRATINFLRQPPLLLARTMQVVGFGAVLTLFMAPIRHDVYSVQNRVGFVQQTGALYFVGMLQNVAVYPAERDVFYREQDDGVYGVAAFALVYTLPEIPGEVLSALLFGCLGVLAIGLPRTVDMYFVACFVCFCIVSCGESLGIMFNTLFGSHTGFAVNLTSIFLSVAQIMGGVMSIDMPELFKAFNYLSPINYAVRAFAPFSLRDVVFTCTTAQRMPDGRCPIENGMQVLQLYKLDVDAVANVAALAGCTVVYRLVAWVLLKLVRTRWEGRAKKSR
ncbi:ABC transporter [Coniochaeta ligniaria NRRL 30616]|uniref:ABC transporter n=1 Tax=Coniochaeta ligniaria NRRL 30616 TaxID=1408157 RepID=A0A1J7IHJ8_9PEZI|nr:ABC transporter [Coniochaeta ligniaria NRRL 30616]